MQCEKCSNQWKLSGAAGPIGNAAPGHFTLLATILAFIAAVLWLVFHSIGAIAFAALVVFFAAMALVGCGDTDKKDRYPGSQCPSSGHKTRIMPWDF